MQLSVGSHGQEDTTRTHTHTQGEEREGHAFTLALSPDQSHPIGRQLIA